MPVVSDGLDSIGQFLSYDPAPEAVGLAGVQLACRYCGHTPQTLVPPDRCPKCYGNSWEWGAAAPPRVEQEPDWLQRLVGD